MPPSGSLYDDPLSPERRPAPSTTFPGNKEIDYLAGAAVASSPNRIITESTFRLEALLPTITPNSSDPIDCWVTVFGFSGAQAAAVLAYFKSIGTIVKTELGQRNWLHIQYDSPWAAQKALLKNGSVLPAAGSCMIGVLPTKNAMEQVGLASTSFMSPLRKSAEPGLNLNLMGSSIDRPAESSSAVPQTPGFPQSSLFSALSQHQPVIASDLRAPNAPPAATLSIFMNEASAEQAAAVAAESATNGSEGVLTKAFNYIFGFQ